MGYGSFERQSRVMEGKLRAGAEERLGLSLKLRQVRALHGWIPQGDLEGRGSAISTSARPATGNPPGEAKDFPVLPETPLY